jgi:Fe-S-cluster containining protein
MPSVLPDALPFECRRCGECCRGFGGTYVSEEDMARIAAYIGVDAATFKQRCVQPSGSRWVLAQAASGFCVFWDQLCTIHPVKPRMCRQWPYIRPVLRDLQNWHSMAASCPGMRTDLPDETIIEAVRAALGDGG